MNVTAVACLGMFTKHIYWGCIG